MAGRTQGWVWKHFYTDRINYKTDKTHHNAWCSAELKFAKLFHFQKPGLSEETPSGRVGKDVDYFWKGAVKNLDKELELYDLLQDVENTRSQEAAEQLGGSSTPIVVG